jgi:hypothetical protein
VLEDSLTVHVDVFKEKHGEFSIDVERIIVLSLLG